MFDDKYLSSSLCKFREEFFSLYTHKENYDLRGGANYNTGGKIW
jgi:hypothetical protein